MDALAKRVADTLRSPAVGKIGFLTPNGLFVAPFEYQRIAGVIETKNINVTVGGIKSPEANAEYQRNVDAKRRPQIALKSDSTGTGSNATEGKATFVHEATHAIFDLTLGGKTIWNLENEFAAYLAGTTFVCALAAANDPGAKRLFSAISSETFMGSVLASLAPQVVNCSGIFTVPGSEMNKCIGTLKQYYKDEQTPMLGPPSSWSAPPMMADDANGIPS